MRLTAVQWESVKSVFDAALKVEPEARPSFLKQKCADTDVLEEVERLLANYQQMGSFINSPALPSPIPQSPQPTPATFAAGEILADRFRVVRFIARGGMGEVYEAEDLELNSCVAVKAIRPDLLRPSFLEQFKNEVQLAKQVTHPNVCRIYDLFRHPTASGTIFFVAMELLAGETLAEHLRRAHLMEVSEVRQIVVQVAEALDAAHAAGILHRDLKPENIMLVAARKPGSVRAVVTDFGLALQSVAGMSIVSPENVAGTPAYMSPEQLLGEDLTPASDIYSLGLVVYRMVTGVRAFEDGEPTRIGLRRLMEAPRRPSELVADLDRRSEAVILKCLEREPSRRYQTARQVAEAFAQTRRSSNPVLQRAALIAGIVLILTWIGWLRSGWHRGVPEPHRRAAVLGFRNASGNSETAWISTALSIYLTADLAAGGKMETVPGQEVTRLKSDLSLPDAESLPKRALAPIRISMGADLVVLGSYRQDNKRVRLVLRALDTAEGRSIASAEEADPPDRLLDLFARAGKRLREALGLSPLTSQEEQEVRALLPANLDAFRPYAEGLQELARFDALGARERLGQAVRAAPRFPLGRSALAEAWLNLGYEEKAKEEVKTAFDASGNLSWRDRQLIEGRYREISKQWDLAADVYRRLWSAFPNESDYGLHLANAQTMAGKASEAFATVVKLRDLPLPLRDDPRIDLAEAQASESVGDFRREQAIAANTAQKATRLGARLLVATANLRDCWASYKLGQPRRAIATAEQARQLFATVGDRAGEASALRKFADVVDDQGSHEQAQRLYEQALAVHREIGDQSGVAVTSNNLGYALKSKGDLAGAKRRFEESLEIAQAILDRGRVALALNGIAIVLRRQGDLTGAKITYERALAIHRERGDKDRTATVINNIATILQDQGLLSAALQRFEESRQLATETGDRSGIAYATGNLGLLLLRRGDLQTAKKDFAEQLTLGRVIPEDKQVGYALYGMGEVSLAEGDLRSARTTHQNAWELRARSGEQGLAAESRAALAGVLLEEGNAPAAEQALREAAQEFRKEGEFEDEACADALLAVALVAEENLSEARAIIRRAAALSLKSEDRAVRLEIRIAAARVRVATGQPTEAARDLQSILAEAKRYGYVGYELQARLALGEAKITAKDPAARNELASVEKEAKAKGFNLIARKAAAAQLK